MVTYVHLFHVFTPGKRIRILLGYTIIQVRCPLCKLLVTRSKPIGFSANDAILAVINCTLLTKV